MVLNRNPPPARRPLVAYSRSAGFVHLYLDDLETLVRYIGDHCDSLTIGAGHALAEEPRDLIGATKDELDRLTIQTAEPAVRVVLNKQFAGASTLEDSDQARALVDGITMVLRGHRGGVWRAFLRSARLATVGVLLVAIGIWAFLIPQTANTPSLAWGSIGMGVVFAVVPVVVSFRGAVKSGRVTLTLRTHDEVQRERSGTRALAITGILGAAVGSGLTFAGQLLAQALAGAPG